MSYPRVRLPLSIQFWATMEARCLAHSTGWRKWSATNFWHICWLLCGSSAMSPYPGRQQNSHITQSTKVCCRPPAQPYTWIGSANSAKCIFGRNVSTNVNLTLFEGLNLNFARKALFRQVQLNLMKFRRAIRVKVAQSAWNLTLTFAAAVNGTITWSWSFLRWRLQICYLIGLAIRYKTEAGRRGLRQLSPLSPSLRPLLPFFLSLTTQRYKKVT